MVQSEKKERIKYLVATLNEASRAYYAEDREVMSNREYDALYDELQALERETGIVLAQSPTVSVGYEAVDDLPKERHESPMLSLDKTKSREALRDWLQGHPAVLSWKLDGLTIVLTYRGGKLEKAVTRGNGEIGEVITNNAKTFVNLPLEIPFKGELVLRGEAVISYSDFEKINAGIEDVDAKYKNPRNLCSGSVRQLNNEITARRNVRFYAFTLVSAEAGEAGGPGGLMTEQFRFLEEQGFEVVEHYLVTEESIPDTVELFEKKIEDYDIPSDGLVLTYDDIAYGQSLGRTAKFPRHSIAFKWADELRETILKEMDRPDQSGGDLRACGTGGDHGQPRLRPQYQHPAGAAAGNRRPYHGVQSEHDHSPDCGEPYGEGHAGQKPVRSCRGSGAARRWRHCGNPRPQSGDDTGHMPGMRRKDGNPTGK